jgi:hypothetical protein
MLFGKSRAGNRSGIRSGCVGPRRRRESGGQRLHSCFRGMTIQDDRKPVLAAAEHREGAADPPLGRAFLLLHI